MLNTTSVANNQADFRTGLTFSGQDVCQVSYGSAILIDFGNGVSGGKRGVLESTTEDTSG